MFFQRVQHRNLMYDTKKEKKTPLSKKIENRFDCARVMYIINKKNLKKKIDSKFTLCESV